MPHAAKRYLPPRAFSVTHQQSAATYGHGRDGIAPHPFGHTLCTRLQAPWQSIVNIPTYCSFQEGKPRTLGVGKVGKVCMNQSQCT